MTDAGLNDVAEVDFLDQLWGDLRGIEGVFQRDSAELGCGEGLEGAVKGTHGGTGGSDDDDFGRGLQISLADGGEDRWDAGGLTIFEEMVGGRTQGCLPRENSWTSAYILRARV